MQNLQKILQSCWNCHKLLVKENHLHQVMVSFVGGRQVGSDGV